jgi:putative PIN family toxin of toxin-antitoxin system
VRVFLDTNVLVSAVATRGLCADLLQICLSQHELLLGETVLRELNEVLLNKLRLPPALADEYLAFLRGQDEVIPESQPPYNQLQDLQLRDASDLPVLAEAVAGSADVLVTGDRDLLEVPPPRPLPLLSPRGFWESLRG